MSDYKIILPSKPRIVLEEGTKGVYEIDGLYPGYGHTLGNSLRRIILSSLPGAAITLVKIDGVSHEFSVMDGVKEDVITILLNLKKVRFKVSSDEPQIISLSIKGPKSVTAGDIKAGGQVEVLNPELHIAEITAKVSLDIEMTVEKGLGFVPKDTHQKSKVDVGTIALDAIFSPVRRVHYEVENMRVGDKTNHNRLRIGIETDGTIDPREALEQSISIMIEQLQAVVDFKPTHVPSETTSSPEVSDEKDSKEDMSDAMKTRIDTLDLSTRTMNALQAANIRTVGGIARKKVEDLLEVEGIGDKGIEEIKDVLKNFGISLKD
ncbi:MAG: DNA-directed RNA polymerase subunit alpha [Candidatus Pacebacteria bacterium]|nr:DNA-directed RNA polymerase subunit alpha [Candidatus Paceibacterota bacterium]MBP9780447.1 DNA-directed RNA polymerase subunit alpha [Candidatus Paceibacterota bacterium]MDQ5950054.1 DNA-directed polymerase subunit alpha [Patescibacteria group bacterium]MDQ5961894.1 DNA-directed polymerase subunit alpha [Patescibacteria group bacterium]